MVRAYCCPSKLRLSLEELRETHHALSAPGRLLEGSHLTERTLAWVRVRPGDFVDRGAWGLEVLLLLAALKLAAPGRVTLLRGNHESSTCTQLYGFRTELARKYGPEVRLPRLACARYHQASQQSKW